MGGASDGSVTDVEKAGCFFRLQGFDVDAGENIYIKEEVLLGRGYEYEAVGNALKCIGGNGEIIYQLFYPDMIDFALYGDMGVCILGDGRIYVVDGEGAQIGEVSTEHCREDSKSQEERLFRDAEGRIYYGLKDQRRGLYRGFELTEEGGWELREIGGNFGEAATSELCASYGRKLLCSRGDDQFLYEYDMEADEKRQVLEWVETGFIRSDVFSAAWAGEGRLLVGCSEKGLHEEIYLLSRTPVEELSEKETVILFSAGTTADLRRAVIKFNQANRDYRVVIDDYGVTAFNFKTMEADTMKVDLAIVSKNPPDMLDMTFLDLEKYASQGALEDLAPYLEGSPVLEREDFLESALEGVTVDGCLTCIPAGFRLFGYFGKTFQLEEASGWGMEDVYKLTEAHPESVHNFMENIFGEVQERDYLLGTFCACYCLEEFVDWEKGECRFDSEKLGRLLDWVNKYAADPSAGQQLNNSLSITENAVLATDIVDALSLPMVEAVWGEEVSLAGLPSADGKEKYWAAVVDALAITTNSTHKEGAWAFLEYYLSQDGAVKDSALEFPVRKDIFSRLIESAMSCKSEEMVDGELRKIKGYVMADLQDEWIPYSPPSQEQVNMLTEAIQSADFRPRSGRERMVLQIISEEAESYYNGDKSIEEVTRIIQNRVSMLIQEG